MYLSVALMNPCKCGWYGHPSGRCRCSLQEVRRYQSRISGPLLDRIDIIVEVPALAYEELHVKKTSESSAEIKKRVDAAREIQRRRYGESGTMINARMDPCALRRYAVLDEECDRIMKDAFEAMGLSARSHDRILRVARTIADLDGSEQIRSEHLAEAIQFRSFELGGEG